VAPADENGRGLGRHGSDDGEEEEDGRSMEHGQCSLNDGESRDRVPLASVAAIREPGQFLDGPRPLRGPDPQQLLEVARRTSDHS
jgi:hypothetical protein